MRTAQRLGDDVVDNAQAEQVFRREFQSFGGLFLEGMAFQIMPAQPSGLMTE